MEELIQHEQTEFTSPYLYNPDNKKELLILVNTGEKHNKIITKIQAYVRGYILRGTKLLEPCDISEIGLDIDKIKKCLINGYLTPYRMEYYKSTSTNNLNLEDGFMEFITADCINGERVGEGHCPIDVIKDDKGIDVLCVCLNGGQTNEKSLTQNFKDSSNELEKLFTENNTGGAINLYKKIWYTKLCDAKKKYNLSKLYYLGFISTNKSIFISVLKVNLNAILNIKDLGFTKQEKSINFKNVIKEKYGTTKLYKSKKRMEIRFHKNILGCHNTIEVYNLNDTV